MFLCHQYLRSRAFLSVCVIERTALPSFFFIKHTLIRFGENFPKFTKLYGIDHWPTFENI